MQAFLAPHQHVLCCVPGAEELVEAQSRPVTRAMPHFDARWHQNTQATALSAWHRHPMQAPSLNKNKGSLSLRLRALLWMTEAPQPGMQAQVEVASHWQHGQAEDAVEGRVPGAWAPSVSPSAQSQISSLLTLDTR